MFSTEPGKSSIYLLSRVSGNSDWFAWLPYDRNYYWSFVAASSSLGATLKAIEDDIGFRKLHYFWMQNIAILPRVTQKSEY